MAAGSPRLPAARRIPRATWQTEPYVVHTTDFAVPYRDEFPAIPEGPQIDAGAQRMLAEHVAYGEVVVPPGKHFVMGASRDESLDSRHWGFAGCEDTIGKAALIYPSHDTAPQHLRRPGVSLRQAADLASSGASKTRWERVAARIK